MRLIDADHLKKWIIARWEETAPRSEYPLKAIDILDQIDGENTIDAEPVKHGKWIMDWTGAEYCSECGKYPFDDGIHHIIGWHSDYCPHCGAKMSPWHEQLIYQREVTE